MLSHSAFFEALLAERLAMLTYESRGSNPKFLNKVFLVKDKSLMNGGWAFPVGMVIPGWQDGRPIGVPL